ncbi:hypothetical protein [Massilia atriviolacea]|nr:hypothetical protein [Massilia atriviolacea]
MLEAYRERAVDVGDSGYVVRYRMTPDAVAIPAVRHQKEARG